jgi:hypothetical protein
MFAINMMMRRRGLTFSKVFNNCKIKNLYDSNLQLFLVILDFLFFGFRSVWFGFFVCVGNSGDKVEEMFEYIDWERSKRADNRRNEAVSY